MTEITLEQAFNMAHEAGYKDVSVETLNIQSVGSVVTGLVYRFQGLPEFKATLGNRIGYGSTQVAAIMAALEGTSK